MPLACASATQATFTFDESNYITGVAIVNPSSASTTVTVTVTDNTGAQIGTSSVNVPANGKIEAALRNLPGLSAVAGARGKAVFSVSSGNIAVLGLRFNGSAFSSIPSVDN